MIPLIIDIIHVSHIMQSMDYSRLNTTDKRRNGVGNRSGGLKRRVHYWHLLGKREQRCCSLPSVALRSFVNGTQVSQNTTRYVLLLRACSFTCGWRRSECGRRGKVSYIDVNACIVTKCARSCFGRLWSQIIL